MRMYSAASALFSPGCRRGHTSYCWLPVADRGPARRDLRRRVCAQGLGQGRTGRCPGRLDRIVPIACGIAWGRLGARKSCGRYEWRRVRPGVVPSTSSATTASSSASAAAAPNSVGGGSYPNVGRRRPGCGALGARRRLPSGRGAMSSGVGHRLMGTHRQG